MQSSSVRSEHGNVEPELTGSNVTQTQALVLTVKSSVCTLTSVSLLSQVQPVLRAKVTEPCAGPRRRTRPRCGQRPEEEGSPAPRPRPRPRTWPEYTSSQSERWSRRRENPACRAQPGGGGDGERAGLLLLPQGNWASLDFNKQLNNTGDKHGGLLGQR